MTSLDSTTPPPCVVPKNPQLPLANPSQPSLSGSSPDDLDPISEASTQKDLSTGTFTLHPVFIADILQIIFENFERPFYMAYPGSKFAHPDRVRSNLLKAALTCRTFLDPALDTLWSYSDSILPFLKLFPSLKLIDGRYVLHGSIQIQDVDRASRYARRVKHLAFLASANSLRPTQNLYLQLSQLLPTPIFPCLRHIYVEIDPLDSMESSFVALSPALRGMKFLDLTVASDGLFESFISSLAVKNTTNLRQLVLSGHLSKDSLRHIFEFKNLQSLELTLRKSIPADVFKLFSKLANLSSLRIVFECIERSGLLSHEESRDSFPPSPPLKNLKTLHVTGNHLDIMIVLRCTQPSNLQSFSVSCQHNFKNYTDCSTTIFRCLEEYIFPSSHSLRNLEIIHGTSHNATCHFALTDLPNISSLLFLEDLSLETPVFSADIVKLEGFLSAWQNLNTIFLPELWSDPVPNLAFLAALQTACPRLQEVYLPILPEMPLPSPADSSSNHPLKTLFVAPSNFIQKSFETQLRVSQYIMLLFPEIAVELWGKSERSTGFWREVQATVKLCQEIKKRAIASTVCRHDGIPSG